MGIIIRERFAQHLHLPTHESPQPRLDFTTQIPNAQMDPNDRTPSGPRGAAPDESSPLLQNDSAIKPYQAYCVTEPPSRVASPNDLLPLPLFMRASISRHRRREPRTTPDRAFAQSPATKMLGDVTFDTLLNWDKENNSPKGKTNRKGSSRSTVLGSADHIARTVTPRGSHSLAAKPTLRYDRTLSQSRVQQNSPAYVAISATNQRKSLPRTVKAPIPKRRPLPSIPVESMIVPNNPHPLPPLPVEVGEVLVAPHPLPPLPFEAGEVPDLETHNGQSPHVWYMNDNSEPLLPQGNSPPGYSFEDRNSSCPSTIDTIACGYQRRQNVDGHIEAPVKQVKPRLFFQVELQSPKSYAPRANVAIRKPNMTAPKVRLWDNHVQFSSTPQAYVSRGLISDMDEDRRAHRRTQPKDAMFQYRFGYRPMMSLEMPPPTPPYRVLPKSSHTAVLQNEEACGRPPPTPTHRILPVSSYSTPKYTANREARLPIPSPLTSFPPFGAQPGPRSPPWGSYEDLEMQRRDRGDEREREDARQFRLRASTGKNLDLKESLVRREVEGYREQVLMVYPDMAFDGSAAERAKGRDCCWCCVMM
jgi:hypothetical protein